MTGNNDEYTKKITEAKDNAVKAAAEFRKQENEKLIDDYQMAQRLKRQMEYAMAMDELRKKHIVHDKHGREVTRWDEIDQISTDLMNGEQNSYNDFRSAMMSLLQAFGKLNKAIAVSREQTFGEYYNKYVYEKKEKRDPLGEAWIKLKSAIREKIKGDADIDLPNLVHNVSFKDGKLDVGPLTRKDGAPLVAYQRDEKGNLVFELDDKGKPKLDAKGQPIKLMSSEPHPANEAFKALVDAWLIEHDYQPVANEPGKYQAPDGSYLDEEAFDRIKPSLAEFLNNPAHSELTFDEPESPSHRI